MYKELAKETSTYVTSKILLTPGGKPPFYVYVDLKRMLKSFKCSRDLLCICGNLHLFLVTPSENEEGIGLNSVS